MSEGKRQRRDSRSPPPPARIRKGGYDTRDDGPSDAAGRNPIRRHDRNRGMERDWDGEREAGPGGGDGSGRHSSDRGYDRGSGGGPGSGRTSQAVGKESPSHDVRGSSRYGHHEQDRERSRDPDRRDGRRERDERVRGGVKREALQVNGDDGKGRSLRDGGAAGGYGGSGDGRERRREREPDSDANHPGRGGEVGPEGSRYMSAEERKERQRQAEEEAKPKAPKEEPNLGLSGKLAAETKKVAGGVELKHVPPPEARLPDKRWRLYVFKNDQLQDEPYRIHRMDHYLFGRDMHVADIITAHPSCSKQHAVLQFRLTPKDDEFGRPVSVVRPYLIDLGSVNGTFLNGERLEALRYYELLEKDVVRLGQSTREYVLLHDKSGDEQAA